MKNDKFGNVILNLLYKNKGVLSVNIGEKMIHIPSNKLQITNYQIYTLKNEGILLGEAWK